MVAGLERYYQIARCYRDEDFRADRQPEFTQLDIEMSFVDQDDVIELSEKLITEIWDLIGADVSAPIAADDLCRRHEPLRHRQAGSALRPGTGRVDRLFRRDVVPGVPGRLRRGCRDAGRGEPAPSAVGCLAGVRSNQGTRGLAYVLVGHDGELGGPVAKNLSESERAGLVGQVGARQGDCVFFAAGLRSQAQGLLGATRLEIGRRLGLIDESAWAFVSIVDAPLFEPSADAVKAGDITVGTGSWTAVHHAFTSPKPESMDSFDTDPGSALAYAYDLVCNGNEIGGGSIRIHRRDIQERVFAVMGLGKQEAQEKFGFLLDAFNYGPPPHGGIAFGWDRICALLLRYRLDPRCHRLPQAGGGLDPLTGAPTPITAEQRKEAGVDVRPDQVS